MKIRTQLTAFFLLITILPMFLIGYWSYFQAKKALQEARLANLEVVADLKVDKIEALFNERRADITVACDYFNIRKNLPIVTKYAQDRTHPEYLQAKSELDSQLKTFQQVYGYSDVMLAGPGGKIMYASDEKHPIELGNIFPDPQGLAFKEGKKGVYLTDVYMGNIERGCFDIIISAPLHDFKSKFIGVVAFKICMAPIYAFVQDTTGLGETGETLLGKKKGNYALFLNPLRHDPNAALRRKAQFGKLGAFPIQEATQGRSGSGISIDYRDVEVIAAWRYLPSLACGLVAKIDTAEAFAPVRDLRNQVIFLGLVVLVLAVFIANFIAKSISDPIKALHRGVEIIGSGNLNYKTSIDVKNEVGALSQAFDQMTTNLKAVTASRDELDQEIAERQRAEQQVKEAMRELQRSNDELEQFAYVASHDLQAPLRMVTSYVQLLQKRYHDKLDEDANEFIGYAAEGATRMSLLINDLLSYSRVGSSGKEPELIDFEEVFNQVDANLKIAIESSGAQLTHDPLPQVMADEAHMVQLLQNLCENSIKFRGESAPRIHVSAQRKSDEWIFSVQDNGIGIDPQQEERVFKLFQRLHTDSEYSGTGIGLTICKRILEQCGGRIWFESGGETGTIFYYTIPIREVA